MTMLTRFSKQPEITFKFHKLKASNIYYSLKINVAAKKKQFLSEILHAGDCEWDTRTIMRLEDISERRTSLVDAVIEIDKAKPLPLTEEARQRLPFEEWRTHRIAEKAWQTQRPVAVQAMMEAVVELDLLSIEMARNEAVLQLLHPAICLRSEADERAYALYRGSVWCSDRDLSSEQWQILASRYLDQEEAELATMLGGSNPESSRERITTEVRRAVWIRDQGKCTRCESRERLEYDHIVPVSRGGGNTERNIELLCEACNRLKSDSISWAQQVTLRCRWASLQCVLGSIHAWDIECSPNGPLLLAFMGIKRRTCVHLHHIPQGTNGLQPLHQRVPTRRY
jgi:hypothetical protein